MGTRGPIRSADSRRGKREIDTNSVVQEALQPSYEITPGEKEIFDYLVESQTKAGVDIRASDAVGYTQLAQSEYRRRAALADADDNLAMKWQRIINEQKRGLGFGAVARARLGLRDKKKALAPILEFIKKPV